MCRCPFHDISFSVICFRNRLYTVALCFECCVGSRNVILSGSGPQLASPSRYYYIYYYHCSVRNLRHKAGYTVILILYAIVVTSQYYIIIVLYARYLIDILILAATKKQRYYIIMDLYAIWVKKQKLYYYCPLRNRRHHAGTTHTYYYGSVRNWRH